MGRTNTSNAAMRLGTHQQQNPSQSHLQSHPEYHQSHLPPAQSQHPQRLSHQHTLLTPQLQQLQTEHSQHQQQIQNQLGQSRSANQPNQQQPIMPVATPSSILNLGRLGAGSGGRLGSALSTSTSMVANAASNGDAPGMVTRAKKPTKASKDGGSSNGTAASRKRSMTTSMVGLGTGVGPSPGLKPLRPGKWFGGDVVIYVRK
jgi:hypothetical protein